MKQPGFKSCAAGIAPAMVMVSGLAAAQQPEDTALEEVIVTAERRSEDLQRTAVSVSVRGGEDMLQQGRFTLQQIVEDVPNIDIGPLSQAGTNNVTDSPATSISIRGVGSNGRSPGNGSVVPAVALYVDGVNNGLGGNYDLKNVQVLRGPQGTLYGRSATAGVVAIQTNDPELGEFSGNAAVEAGSYDLLHYSAAANVPISDTFALRVAGNHYRQEGYYSPSGDRVHTSDGRVKLLFQPNDRLSLLLGVAAQSNREYSGQNQGTLTVDGSVNYDFVVPLGTGHDDTRQYWAQLDWDFGPATLTYLPAYRTFEQHALVSTSPAPGSLAESIQSFPTDTFHTQELRFTSNATSGIKWQSGLFYYDNRQEYLLDFNQNVPGIPIAVFERDDYSRRTRDLGAFAEATLPLNDTWRFTAGLRYDRTKVQTEKTQVSNLNATFSTLSLTVGEDEGTRSWNNWTYKARLEHDLTSGNLLYAAVTTGFLPGDTFISTVEETVAPFVKLAAITYEPETLTSFEIGSKNRFLDDRLQVNGDVFYYDYGAFQQPVGRQAGPIQLYTIQSSPARMEGAELETIFQLTPADTLALSVGYIDAYYVDKPAAFANGVSQSKVAGIAPWTIDPSYTHTFELPQDQFIRLQAQATYRSAHNVSSIPSANAAAGLQPYYRNDDEVTGNVYLTWQHPRLSVTGYVRNVSDERFKTSVGTMVAISPGQGEGRATLSAPRTYGVVLTAAF